MSLFLNGPIRWAETYPRETKASFATTIKIEGILQRIVEPYGIA